MDTFLAAIIQREIQHSSVYVNFERTAHGVLCPRNSERDLQAEKALPDLRITRQQTRAFVQDVANVPLRRRQVLCVNLQGVHDLEGLFSCGIVHCSSSGSPTVRTA